MLIRKGTLVQLPTINLTVISFVIILPFADSFLMPDTTKIRIVTAASLFDGHDAAINIMRRILQSKGAEIIHLGHNRSVREIVECAIEEEIGRASCRERE